MHLYISLLMAFLIIGCSTNIPHFKKEEVCTETALKYLRNPRNKTKRAIQNSSLINLLSKSCGKMQLCYEKFKERTGFEEFNTCMVVGVDESRTLEFYNFGSEQVVLDDEFINCTKNITRKIPYERYGQNYILIQSYKFFVTSE